MLLSVDWAHTKDYACYDGKKLHLVPLREVLKLVEKADRVVIEHGAPLKLQYQILRVLEGRAGKPVAPPPDCDEGDVDLIEHSNCASCVPSPNGGGDGEADLARSNHLYESILLTIPTATVQRVREDLALEKSDENDAVAIWTAATLGEGLRPVQRDAYGLRLHQTYHEYRLMQKERIALNNTLKAARRQYLEVSRANELAFGIAMQQFTARETSLERDLAQVAPAPPGSLGRIKGLGPRIWAGIICEADPRDFPTCSAYLKYCGMVDRQTIAHRFNRGANVAYHLLADQVVKQRDPVWRPVYDKWKVRLSEREGYTHPHRGAMNRLKTALARHVWRTCQTEEIFQQAALAVS